ncbi:MAG: AAA family ATPase [Gaiella sp.]
MSEPAARPSVGIAERVLANLATAVRAPEEVLRLPLLCLLAEGHALIEDVPGVGKTMLAKALARSFDLGFARVQFTPDLLPSDVTGVSVYDQRSGSFAFRPGPVFTNVLLVDEINRASPRTQSALLEAMQETQVTVDGESHLLQRPFLVLATQNPLEFEGTYPLPEAQLDRFAIRMSVGYPSFADEARLLASETTEPALDRLQPVAGADEVLAAIVQARAVFVEESVNRYVVALLRNTRESGHLALGASPRAGIALLRLAKALAFVLGRDYVTPEDIQAMAVPALAHRVLPAAGNRDAGAVKAIEEAVSHTPAPV